MRKKIIIVLPAYNEEKVIGKVINKLKRTIGNLPKQQYEIVVVDDCSFDNTLEVIKGKGVTVLRHIINRGLGGALKTGFNYARSQNADILVSMDSDGQHEPSDIKKLIVPILESKADIIIGKRNIREMPFDRKIITFFSSLFTLLFFGIWCSDTQSGFRTFSKKAINNIEIKTQRMEVSSEFFSEIAKHKLKFMEVPIKVIYTEYSRLKGQPNLNSIKILLRLLLRLAR